MSDELMLRIYKAFLDMNAPVRKINYDYCYAIYMSLVEDTLRSIFIATMDIDKKLSDILRLLRTKAIDELFHGVFDPMFKNLSHRDSLLEMIQDFLHTLPTENTTTEKLECINKELLKYGEVLRH